MKEDKAYDKVTKLTWKRCSLGSKWKKGTGCVGMPKKLYYDEATKLVKEVANGWRIPTIDELYSISGKECKENTINTTVFPDIKDMPVFAPYWSISPLENMPNLIYYIDFVNNYVDVHSKGYSMFIRLVRSPDDKK